MELTGIKGLGPAKIDALQAVGVGSVEDLAGLDLRRNVEVQGITQDGLKALKVRARQALRAEDNPIPKAPYTRGDKTAPHAKQAPEEQDPVVSFGKKRGFLRRILTLRP